jgi:urea transport system substrate-binding protein
VRRLSVAKGAAAEDTIKIGILHSLSGTMAISETILKDLMLMQVAELNQNGGLLGLSDSKRADSFA